MNISQSVQRLAVVAALLAAPAVSADYVGTLRLPGVPSASSGFYSFSSIATPSTVTPTFTADATSRVKLGYKYSRYLSVESEYIDFGTPGGVFASPTNLSSAFRSTGIAVDTVATLPLWRQFSFYGRLGAYSGSRNIYFSSPTSLLGDSTRTRVRYGLGMRYDFTKAFGIRAELDRYAQPGSVLAGEAEADVFAIGLSWRF
jgi:hypothetical protein